MSRFLQTVYSVTPSLCWLVKKIQTHFIVLPRQYTSRRRFTISHPDIHYQQSISVCICKASRRFAGRSIVCNSICSSFRASCAARTFVTPIARTFVTPTARTFVTPTARSILQRWCIVGCRRCGNNINSDYRSAFDQPGEVATFDVGIASDVLAICDVLIECFNRPDVAYTRSDE